MSLALVTGASRGIGAASAVALAAAGHDLALHYRTDADGAARVADQVRAAGADAHTHHWDPDTDPALLLDQMPTVPQVVVLAAFPQDITPWPELTPADWDAMWTGGLRSTALLLHAVTEAMASGGAIVLLGSIEGFRPAPGHAPYAVAKAGLHQLVAAAATAVGPRGIRVNAVAPGLTERPGLDTDWPEGLARWSQASALRRPVTAAEVGAAVAWLAAPAASGVTGIVLPVDAGWSASPGW
ncbi:MAG: SDR family NAD(P)-dependent oxidoreductase [Nostocoides sp.]